MPKTYSVLGGDARQRWLASMLTADGFSVTHSTDTFTPADVVILPIPSLSVDGTIRGTTQQLSDVLSTLSPGTTIWGSGLAKHADQAEAHQVHLLEFTNFESFATQNAIPTAEGAIQIAMEELPATINGGRFLVIGYGRIGTKLAALLDALGGIVTVARRQPIRLPYQVDRTGDYQMPLYPYDAIFNTVPSPVLSAQQCAATKEDCLLVDLASAPGGIAKDGGRRVIHALGLPAKVAPKTAARIMKDIILSETEG